MDALRNALPSIPEPRRVAVIGAGSAGLGAALELNAIKSPDGHPAFQTVLFERRPQVGGIWVNDDDAGECKFFFDQHGRPHPVSVGRLWPPSPIYDGLRPNLCLDLMCYRDNAIKSDVLFPPRAVVQQYLDDFASRHNLKRQIRFETIVSSLRRIRHDDSQAKGGRGSVWQLTSRDLRTGKVTEEEYHHIVLASGKCNVPNVPTIPGLWLWRGELLHSSFYRTPTVFRNKSVLVIGNNSSGMDVARELNGKCVRTFPGVDEWVADASASPPRTGVKVRQSVEDVNRPPQMDFNPNDPESPEWSRRIEVVPKIVRVEAPSTTAPNGTVVLEDGTRLEDVDVIVFATGFLYDLPFLDQSTAPFDERPMLSNANAGQLQHADQASLKEFFEGSAGDKVEPYTPPYEMAPHLSNLDSWHLFYEPDPSISILGVFGNIVPFPFAHMQARFVANFWAGRAEPLPRLRADVPLADPARWTSVQPADEPAAEAPPTRFPHKIGFPSDWAYLDELLRRIPGGGQPAEWEKDEESKTDGKGGGGKRGVEGDCLTTTWRKERGPYSIYFRRQELGY
ncbi:monooxygenase [Tilletia horrida]|nr:monooxygenase [Tilletia horrida]